MIIKNLTEIKYLTILKVSGPTMLSSLSAGIMSMLDILILAKYSTIAMIGVTAASTWCHAFQCSTVALVFITETLVGHYNGAGKYKCASMPVWQMIWFSLFLFIISIPLPYIISPYCIPEKFQEYGIPYIRIVMGLSPMICIKVAISSFLVSISKGFIVFISSFIAIVVNATLDIILIFYFNQGTVGAAIGTVMACFTEIIFLSYFFFKRSIRTKYGTLNCKLRFKRLCSYLKLGVFSCFANVVDSIIFSSIYYILVNSSTNKELAQTIASNTWRFLACLGSGFEKGIIAIASNLLGSNNNKQIKVLFKMSINLHLVFIGILFIIVLYFPNLIITNFVDISKISPESYLYLTNVLLLVITCFIFEGIVWVEEGILAAGGDINYMMLSVISCSILFIAFPIFCIIDTSNLSVKTFWILYTFADIVCTLVLFSRYKSDKWIKIKV